MLRLVSLCGIAVMLAICFAFSKNRRAISWRLVGVGLVMQAVLGFTFLYWSGGNAALRAFGDGIERFLDKAKDGSRFVFGPMLDTGKTGGFVFAFMVLPTLIFFSSFMAVLYHVGLMQVIVRGMAWVMVRVLGTSGSESLSACANVFVGQTEAPLLVRPFLGKMTQSEIHAVMTGGFATIAGGVFALYVSFGIDAGHLMVASVMAVPAGLVCSKVMFPELGEPETRGKVHVPVERNAGNLVEAAANGALDGLKLALNVGAMLIAFLGLVAVADWLLDLLTGPFQRLSLLSAGQHLSLDWILSRLFAPIAWVMGVQSGEVMPLAQLLGKKIVLTELVAYADLGQMKATLSPRTVMIASFALCGFANLGSVAIQIGGLGAMAPERKGDIARLAFRAMFAGAIATCMTACLAGVIHVQRG